MKMTTAPTDLVLSGAAVFPPGLISAIFAVALLTAGAVLGVLAVVALGVHREERARSLMTDITDRVARGARAANGLYTHMPGSARHHRRETLPTTGREGQEEGTE